ncbi:MAG: hypothetical protein ABIW58_02100 [Sphingomicrobium sp.]
MPAFAWPPTKPRNFIYLGQDDLDKNLRILDRPDIAGVEVIYVWLSLEPRKDHYDFSMIEYDLALTQARGKAMYIQVGDRFFHSGARYVPRYLLDDPQYDGGLARQAGTKLGPQMSGWVAQQWNPNLRQRFQALLKALARKFDGRIAGIILPETAIDLDKDAPPKGFTCDSYFNAELENALMAKRAFRHSSVIQYANFWPCDWANSGGYMGRFFEFAAANHIGVGGPDIVPWQKAQMLNSYAFIRVYKDKVPVVAMSIQEPTLEYLNPETGKPYTRDEFERFASVYLGVDDIFWSPESPWLRDGEADTKVSR